MDLKSIFDALNTKLKSLSDRIQRLEKIQLPLIATGTFTPSFAGTTGAGTFTYVIREGAYFRFGPVCLFSIRLQISAISVAPTGNMIITGLPITSHATYPPCAVTTAPISNIDYRTGVLEIGARVGQNTTSITLFEFYDNSASISYPASAFTNANATLTVTGFYFV